MPLNALWRVSESTPRILLLDAPVSNKPKAPMSPRLVAHLALIAVALGIAQDVRAQNQSEFHTLTVPLTTTQWSQPLLVPRFDPQLGRLVSIGVSLTGRATGSARVESQDSIPAIIVSTFQSRISILRPDMSVVSQSTPTAIFNDAFTAFDGVIDFGGTSGASHLGIDVADAAVPVTLSSAADLALFTGPFGVPGNASLPAIAQGTSLATGAGNIISQFQQQAGATVIIAYTYDPTSGLRLRQASTAAIPGRTLDYFVTVRNTANVPFNNLDVLASVDPRILALSSVGQPALVSTSTATALGFAAWSIPQLLPGETKILTYRATLNSQIPLGSLIHGGPVWAGYGLLDSWASCTTSVLLTSPDCACAFGCCVAECLVSPGACLDCRAACQVQGCPGAGLACLASTRDLLVSCFDASAQILARFIDESIVVGPQDPNEKRTVNPTFVQPDERIVYAIHYENIGTLPAQQVTVTDALQTTLNANSVQVYSGGTFNPSNRTVSWQVSGVQLAPGESGTVFFSAEPVPNQPPGSEVRNKATIAFESQPGQFTNEVVSRIDGVRPTASINQLPPTTPTADFLVSWSGVDAVGNIQDYSVYVSRDGGDYQLFRYQTTSTSALFTGVSGARYDFFCVARDTAGNFEPVVPVSEASTVVSTLSTSFCAGDGGSTACPCGNSSPLGAAAGCLNALGTGGKLEVQGVASISIDSLVLIGAQMPDCPSLYFQGTVAINNGFGVAFGDGVRCAGGTAIRLGIKTNATGGSRYPDVGDVPLAQRGFVLPGSTRIYQCWYRDAVDFCSPSTFNFTNGRRVTWGP